MSRLAPACAALLLGLSGSCQVTTSSTSSSAKPAQDTESQPRPIPAAEPEARPEPEGEPEAGGGTAEPTPAKTVGDLKTSPATKCDDSEHKPGDRWKVECNDCWCKDDGKVVCTRKACKQG